MEHDLVRHPTVVRAVNGHLKVRGFGQVKVSGPGRVRPCSDGQSLLWPEVRVNAVVHLNARVAVGQPAQLFPPAAHERMRELQEKPGFPGAEFGIARPPASETLMPEAIRRYSELFGTHGEDRALDRPWAPAPGRASRPRPLHPVGGHLRG